MQVVNAKIKLLLVSGIVLLACVFIPASPAFARTYGEGPYGVDMYQTDSANPWDRLVGELPNTGQKIMFFAPFGIFMIGVSGLIFMQKRSKKSKNKHQEHTASIRYKDH